MEEDIHVKCRGCKKDSCSTILSLGTQEVSSFGKETHTSPLRLMLCSSCGLVQLSHSVPPEWFHEWYGYRSGINEEMVEALRKVFDSCVERLGRISGGAIVDIGANDGTLLKMFSGMSKSRIAFEPAKNLAELLRKNCDFFVQQVFSREMLPSFFEKIAGTCQLVTAIAMFYDVDRPLEFLKDVAYVLAPDGMLVIQMNYLGAMVRDCTFDNISHEHLCYYSMTTLQPLLASAGLEAFEVELNDVNGGSFRVYCRHKGSESPEAVRRGTVEKLLSEECEAMLLDPSVYVGFKDRIEGTCKALFRYLRYCKNAKEKVAVCGASTRGLVILQAAGIGKELIECASERNPEKWGRMYAGTGIRCVPEEEARSSCKVLLVLPYHLRNSIQLREKKFLEGGGRMVFPLPHPVVVWHQGERDSGGEMILHSKSLMEG